MRKIGEGATVFSGYAFKSTDFAPYGIPVIKIKNVNNRIVTLSEVEHFPLDKVTEKMKKFFLENGDVLIAMTGQGSVGRVGKLRLLENQKVLLNQRVGKFITKSDILDSEFLYQIISSSNYEQILFDTGSGSGQPNLSPDNISDVKIPFPDISNQRKIAMILSPLDDKVWFLQKQNEVLEKIIQSIFKSWFIDFEEQIEFVDSDLGQIPKGWKVDHLGSIVRNIKIQTNPRSIENQRPYIGLEHMPRGSIVLNEWGINEGLLSNKFEFNEGDILFGKLRPYFKKVVFAPFDGICSTDILVLNSKSSDWFSYVLCIVASENFINYTNMASTGTRMPRTDWGIMSKYSIVLPPEEMIIQFNHFVRKVIDQIKNNIFEIHTLSKIQYSILPKLISGEIQV